MPPWLTLDDDKISLWPELREHRSYRRLRDTALDLLPVTVAVIEGLRKRQGFRDDPAGDARHRVLARGVDLHHDDQVRRS